MEDAKADVRRAQGRAQGATRCGLVKAVNPVLVAKTMSVVLTMLRISAFGIALRSDIAINCSLNSFNCDKQLALFIGGALHVQPSPVCATELSCWRNMYMLARA